MVAYNAPLVKYEIPKLLKGVAVDVRIRGEDGQAVGNGMSCLSASIEMIGKH